MLAFEIEINGEKVVTAGVEDWSILSAIITASRSKDDEDVNNDRIELSTGSLSCRDKENISYHIRWPEVPLKIGSVVTLRIIDAQSVDAPKKCYRSDSKVQESPFTEEEVYEMEYQNYLYLKEKFESGN